MDYIQFWTGFQKIVNSNSRIQELFDDSRNETGRGKDKNSFVFDFVVDKEKIPYNITAQVNTRVPFISVDMYFKKKKKYAQEVLEFFVEEREALQKRLGSGLYVSDMSKSEVRVSLRNNLSVFDADKYDEYYNWFIQKLIQMGETFEGLRYEKGFYPERTA